LIISILLRLKLYSSLL